MDTETEEVPKRRKGDSGIPDWAKLSISVAGTAITTTALVILWVNGTFVTKTELLGHVSQQQLDIARVADTQKIYAVAEISTAKSLSEIQARLVGIEVKLQVALESANVKR